MPEPRLDAENIRALPDRSRRARLRAIAVVDLMRDDGLSLTAAADRVGTTRKTVLKYTGRALEKGDDGEWEAKPWDRIIRLVKFPKEAGPKTLPVRDSRSADKVARYWDAVDEFRETGNEEVFEPFRGETVQVRGKQHDFLTDPDLLKRQTRAGVLTFEHLYESTT